MGDYLNKLVALCRCGDEKAREELLLRVHNFTVMYLNYRSSLHSSIPHEEKKDISHDVIIRFYKSVMNFKFDNRREVLPYVKKIINNLCLDYLKRNKRIATVTMEYLKKIIDDKTKNNCDIQETREIVAEILNNSKFDELDRQIWFLKFIVEDLSAIKIAKLLDKPVGTIHCRFSRFYEKFRQIIFSNETYRTFFEKYFNR